jgi:Transglycosylase SLT domain
MLQCAMRVSVVSLLVLFTLPVLASPNRSAPSSSAPPPFSAASLCEAAVSSAELAYRLPPRLLGAIAFTESGRLHPPTGAARPWPWTINAEGEGQFFASKTDAMAAVRSLQARGVRSIDVGCMQINLFHHPAAFRSLDEAFDPVANARYGARFLTSLHAASGNWQRAIAAYHSETPARGAAYRALVLARWQPMQAVAEHQPSALTSYRAFASGQSAYAAFQPMDRAYAAFSRESASVGWPLSMPRSVNRVGSAPNRVAQSAARRVVAAAEPARH